jgi:hypothetical protein
MYVMVCSHPDLSHTLSVASRYMANPEKEHWKSVRWIFRYLRSTFNARLQFGESGYGFLLIFLILIMLVIWTREDPSHIMFSPLVVLL